MEKSIPDQESGIIILIMAAGAASRMKCIKQVLPFKKTTLLGNAISQAIDAGADEVITVLGANAEEIENQVSHLNSTIIVNNDWQKGLGSSIASGVGFVMEKRTKCQAVLVMLADQPLIDSGYLKKIIEAHLMDRSFIVATAYGKNYGVPSIFPRSCFAQLAGLEGDRGARSFLNRLNVKVTALQAAGKTVDIDTPEDYSAFI